MRGDTDLVDEQTKTDVQRIGRAIRDRREARDWNQSDLARRAGVRPSYINRLELGGYGRPSAERLTRIADALGCRLADLTDPVPAGVASGIEAELRAMFRPDEAPLVAEILRGLARHDTARQRFVLNTIRPLVQGLSDLDGQ